MKSVVKDSMRVAFAVCITLASAYLAPARSEMIARSADNNEVRITMDYKVHLTGRNDYVRLVTLVPKNISNKQKVLNVRYSLEPARLFEENGNRYAEFFFNDPRGDIDILINADVALQRADLSSLVSAPAPKDTDCALFLKDEPYLEKNCPEVMSVARRINGKDEMDTVRKLYDYVTHVLKYKGYVAEDVGAAHVLCSVKAGDCSDFSDCLVALARAKDIPARTVDGFLTEYSDNNPRHTWVEIYTGGYGWVPFDPLLGSLGQASFERLSPKYVYLSGVRNDDVLDNYHFFACRYAGSPVKVTDSYEIVSSAIMLTKN